MVITRQCPFCNLNETLPHLLYDCEIPKLLKNTLRTFLGVNFISWETVRFLAPLPVPKEIIHATLVVLAEINFQVWKTRNRLIFEYKRDTAKVTLERVRIAVAERVRADKIRLPETTFLNFWCNPVKPFAVVRGDSVTLLF